MIPVSNTHITIVRSTATGDTDLYDPDEIPDPPTETIASGIRAAVDPPTASVNLVAGQRQVYGAKISADPCDLQANDIVTTDDGTVWTCLWARAVTSIGMSFVEGQLRLVKGYGV